MIAKSANLTIAVSRDCVGPIVMGDGHPPVIPSLLVSSPARGALEQPSWLEMCVDFPKREAMHEACSTDPFPRPSDH